ncbi:uncharacterized protein [Phaseolus vulgaris]|uniref:uncharacterized protein n=1 Tax=Phaseolus vulgaris TaxID=3885 RepID=UPI0035CB8AE6
MSMQQVMDMMRGLQDEMAESRAEQERMQADLAASHVRNDELHRINEQLRRGLGDNQGQRDQNETEPLTPPREFSTPFSQEILEAVIPNTFAEPKVIFTGMEDPEAHLTAFHTQMQLSQLFKEQYLANRAPPPVSYDLFDVKQYQGETLKEHINRFGAQLVKVGTTEEPIIVYAFRKCVCPGPFCESIIRNRPRTFAEIRRRAVEHIASEGEVCEKRTSVVPSRPRAQTRAQPVRVNETTTGRKKQEGKRPYETRKPQPRGPAGKNRPTRERARPARYDFVVELKDLIAVPNIAERLRRPAKTDKVLGPRKDSWCEFHEAFGHHINNCLSLGYQLDELVRSGFLKD